MSSMKNRTYLDYNATAPLRPEAREALNAALDIGNPSSVHEEGRKARGVIEAARRDIADLVIAHPETVIFTSGGTEACNLALNLRDAPNGKIERLLVSAIEHSAVLQAAHESDLPVTQIPVTADGVVDMAAFAALLEDETPALVCVMLANNETGVIQPIAEIGRMVKEHGSLLFCDAVQAAGKMPINMIGAAFDGGIDALSLSGHKMGAPMGVGALVTRPGVVVPPVLIGGGQELGRRAGSENISGIAAFAAAAEASKAALDTFQKLAVIRDDMEAALRAIAPNIHIFGQGQARLANTSCFALEGLNSETLVMALDLAGIAVSAGSACSSGKVSRSHVLAAMGVETHISKGVLRVSLGWQSTAEDSEKLVAEWGKLAKSKPREAAE